VNGQPDSALTPSAALLSRRAAAKLVGLSPRTIGRLRSAGRFPEPVLVPGLRDPRYPLAAVLAWLAALQPECAAPPRSE